MESATNYYVIFKKDDVGSPVSLEAVLLPYFYEKSPFEGKGDNADTAWRTPLHKPVELPSDLWLITKDRSYKFDCYADFGGFIMSEQFLSLINEFGISNYHSVKLHVVNGRKEPIKAKIYFYVKFYSGIDDAIDLNRSRFDRDKQGGYIKKYHEVYLTDKPKPDVFVVNDLVLGRNLFCSQAFMTRAEAQKMYGIVFVPVKEAGNYKVVFRK